MDDLRIAELLRKKISGEISLPEQNELYKLKENNEANQEYFRLLEEFNLIKPEFNKPSIESSYSRIRNNVFKKIRESEDKNRNVRKGLAITFWQVAVAASILVIIGCSIYFWDNSSKPTEQQKIETVTLKGSKSSLTLPDGTKVWVNADSKLSYGKSFGKNTRDVTLIGEAYFDVVKDKSRPFIVHASKMSIRVLGTQFNVKAYPREKTAEATLLQGSIEMTIDDEKDRKILLKPHEKIVVQNNVSANQPGKKALKTEPLIEIQKLPENNEVIPEIEWIHNRLAFSNETMDNIFIKLERWYNVRFIIKKRFPKDKTYVGTFENESIDEVLESLKLFNDFHYSKDTGAVTIY
jgi:ferric-dicitrate binding protein FerR (iron transport regulator)